MSSYVQIPPDSSGKKILTMQHTVSGSAVEVQHVHVADATDPIRTQKIDVHGASYTRFTEGQPIMDALNRLKTVHSMIVGVYDHSNDGYDDLFTIEAANSGTSVYSADEASVLLSTTTTPGSSISRTTNRYHYFQPGCPIVVLMTVACGDAGKDGNIRAWGLFDDEDGVYFTLSGTQLAIVLRSAITGEEVAVPQASWSLDTLDGSGSSGIRLDVTKDYVYWMDIGWDAGAVRVGVYKPDGTRVVAHVFKNGGAYSFPFMRQGSLPLRLENFNTGPTSGNSTLREGMMVVKAEGELDYTFWRFADMGCEAKACPTGSLTALFGVRSKIFLPGKTINNHVNVFPEQLSVHTDVPIKIQLVNDPVVSGSTWNIPGDDLLEGDNTATTATLGENSWAWHIFYAGPGVTNLDLRPIFELNDEGVLLAANNATRSELYFVVKPIGTGSATVTADLSYRELY